jgi:hypothetical protein
MEVIVMLKMLFHDVHGGTGRRPEETAILVFSRNFNPGTPEYKAECHYI